VKNDLVFNLEEFDSTKHHRQETVRRLLIPSTKLYFAVVFASLFGDHFGNYFEKKIKGVGIIFRDASASFLSCHVC
jgi:hypothetical protein